MAYIIAVNVSLGSSSPSFRTHANLPQAIILSQTGGTCVCDLQDKIDCDSIPAYKACKEGQFTTISVSTAVLA
jgi:hypothetical protein